MVGHLDAQGGAHPRKARPEQQLGAAVSLTMERWRANSGEGSEADVDVILTATAVLERFLQG
ncbi:hypothetical protein D9599_28170 [Roseomonas sp. KE2513]|nr:hypothetical protein [Roseomonas sp. KE2513]